ncbi:MAG: type II secretion system inner membrane protein GspF [Gammaproteobacteria bacterium]|jgi:general secretion pathway protein F
MSAFSWQALDKAGTLKKGVREADSPKHLRQMLRKEGLNPLSMEEVSGRKARSRSRDKKAGSGVDRSLSPADLAMFTRQLATLLRSRMPLEECLRVLARQTNKSWQSSLITALRARVSEGMSLADGFRQFPRAFPEYFASTAEAGEQAGKLEIVLERLADYAEEANTTRQKVMLSLMYPVVVAIVAVIVVTILLVGVVPKMVETFEHMEQELPFLTRLMIGISEFLQHYGLYFAAGVGLLGFLFSIAYRRKAFRRRMHALYLKLPLVSRVIREVNTARFLRTYGILLSSSVSATSGMNISARVLGNLPIRESLRDAADRVREGASIANSLTRTGYFSPMTLNLVASGEASGNLPEMLERAGDGQERTLQASISMIVGIMEPLMIVIMGVLVLLIVLAILMPIFQMNTAI